VPQPAFAVLFKPHPRGTRGLTWSLGKEGFHVASVSVTIPTSNAWPTSAEMTARNAVTESLTAEGIGTCTGAGGGGGEMDFSFRVADEMVARSCIDAAMQAHMPGVKYRVRVSD
jgi:hypothetical protein